MIFFNKDNTMSHIYTCSLRDWVHKVYPNPCSINNNNLCYSGCNPRLLAMKNQKRSKSQGQVAYFSKKNTSLKYKKATLSDAPLQQHCAVHLVTAIPLPNAIALCLAAHCIAGVAHCHSSGAESIILSAGST